MSDKKIENVRIDAVDMELRKKLDAAKDLLLLVMPHFSPLLEAAQKFGEIAILDEVPTACTYPGGKIVFGRVFLQVLSLMETAFIIAHELGHHYMATFSREETIQSQFQCSNRLSVSQMHDLINVASDVHINNYVASYFEAHSGLAIRDSENLRSSMWWEANRFWVGNRILPQDILMQQAGFLPVQKLCLSLKDLSERLLPSGKFLGVDELSMEDTLAALELFTLRGEAEGLNQVLGNQVLSVHGGVKCKRQSALPFFVPIQETFGELENDCFVVKINGSKQNGAKDDFKEVIPQIFLHIHSLVEGTLEVLDLDIPLACILKSQGEASNAENALKTGDEWKFQIPFIAKESLRFMGSLSVSYDKDGVVQISGEITCRLNLEKVIGKEGRSGDMGNRESLKEQNPGLTDEDIDNAIEEMEKARHAATGLLPGTGRRLDQEVRKGFYDVPWQAYLQKWIDGHSCITRTYYRASRRGDAVDARCCLPGHRRSGKQLNIVLDTSGSMMAYLPKALGAIATFCEKNMVDGIKILECDSKIQDIKEITPEQLRKYSVCGGGGTDMTPAMTAFENDASVSAVIVITDDVIKGRYPRKRLPYDVLWCLVGEKKQAQIPYGKQVHIAS